MVLSWWLWLLLGLLLFLLELLTPGGFYVIFFGIGAILVGLLASTGLAGPAWTQWLLFAASSLAALLLFRRPLLRRIRSAPDRNFDSMVGETAIALGEIGKFQTGKAELRGSAWSARNTGDHIIAPGQRCRVESVEGLTLCVQGESEWISD